MEVRQQRVDTTELEAREDEERRAALEPAVAGDRLEHAHRRRADSEHPLGRIDPGPGRWVDAVALTVQRVLLELGDGERPEGVEPDMEGDVLDVELGEQLRREVEPRRRRRGRAGIGGVDGLVAPGLGERLVDVRRQGRFARRLAVEVDAPASLAERLEQLDRAQALAGAEPTRGARKRLPDAVAERLEQEDLGAPPEERCRFRRAGTTLVSLTTTSSPVSSSGSSANVR